MKSCKLKSIGYLLIILSLILSAFAFVSCDSDNGQTENGTQNKVKEGDQVKYSVVYSYEQLDGTWDSMTVNRFGIAGDDVTADEFLIKGYELDSENADYVPSGKASESLCLKMPYKLARNNLNLANVVNADVSLRVSGEISDTARFGETVEVIADLAENYILEKIGVVDADGNNIPLNNNAFVMPNCSVNITVNVTQNNAYLYTVEHWLETLDGNGYSIYYVENKYGTAYETVTATALNYSGLTENAQHAGRVVSGELFGNGTLVLKLYYKRNAFSVEKVDGDVNISVSKQSDVLFGEKVIVSLAEVVEAGYDVKVFIRKAGTEKWDEIKSNGSVYKFNMPAYSTEVKAVRAASKNTAYSVEHWGSDLGGGYSLRATERLYGMTGSTVSVEPVYIKGFVYDGSNVNAVTSGKIAGNGSLVLKLFYNRENIKISYLNADGALIEEKFYPYGTKGVELPDSDRDYYIESADKFYFWSYNNRLFNPQMSLTDDITVRQKYYDKEIYSVEDFKAAFSLREENGIYLSETISEGSYILMTDLDFKGVTMSIAGLNGLFEGNGYSLNNINVYMNVNGLFTEIGGIIRNVSFIDIKKSPFINVIEESGLGILRNAGLIAEKLSGTLENVYIKGSMRGKVYSTFYWDFINGQQLPGNDVSGEPQAGIIAYNATGATLKNIVIDVETSYTDNDNTTLNVVAGRGAFKFDNVFVIYDKGVELQDKYAAKGILVSEMGISCGSATDLKDGIVAKLGSTGVWDTDNFKEKIEIGLDPMQRDCVAKSRKSTYVVYHYLAKYSASSSENLGEYEIGDVTYGVGAVGEMTHAEALSFVGFSANDIQQKTISENNGTVINVYYERDGFVESFELKSSLTGVSNSGGRTALTGNEGVAVKVKENGKPKELHYLNAVNSGEYSLRYRNNNDGNGRIRVNLTGEQKVVLENDSQLSFYIRMVNDSVFSSIYAMRINGSTAYTIEANKSIMPVEENGHIVNGQINIGPWRGNYAKVLVDSTLNAKIAQDGFLEISTEWLSGDQWKRTYTIWLDDITVEKSENLIMYAVKHYLAKTSSSNPSDITGYDLADVDMLVGYVGEMTEATAKEYMGYTAETITQREIVGTDKITVNIFYSSSFLVQYFEYATDKNNPIIGYDGGSGYIQDGKVDITTNSNDLIYWNCSAYSGSKSAVLRLNNGSTGYGKLSISLTDEQIAAINDKCVVTFYIQMIGKTAGETVWNMKINDSTDFEIEMIGSSCWLDSVGRIKTQSYRRGYAKVTLGVTAAVAAASDGYLKIYTYGYSKTSADYNYYMFIDDIEVHADQKYIYRLSFGDTGVYKELEYGETIGELPVIANNAQGYVGVWTLDGVEITADTVWSYKTDKQAEIYYYNPLLMDFENANSVHYYEGGSGYIQTGNVDITTNSNELIYWNCGAYSGSKCAVLRLNNGGDGRGKLSIDLTAEQIAAINNGGTLTFYLQMIAVTAGEVTWRVRIADKYDFALETIGSSCWLVEGAGDGGYIKTQSYRRGYAKVTLSAEAAAIAASEGFFTLFTVGYSKTAADYNYYMFVDDVEVVPAS